MKNNIIGIELGSDGGRMILAKVGGGSFSFEETHRFRYEMIEKGEILTGLIMIGDKDIKIDSIGIDGEMAGNPAKSVSYLLTGNMSGKSSSMAPGTVIGTLRKEIGNECGLGPVPIISVAGDDTTSAVAAVPAEDENFAYLNLETHSFMGIETSAPILNTEASSDNFINEYGVNGSNHFYKKMTGMWILERCMKEWEERGKKHTKESIARLMEKTRECISIIDVDDSIFVNPKSMLAAIDEYCSDHRLPIPNTDAMVIRCIFDSLTEKVAQTIKKINSFAPFPINRLHIIGSGSQNDFLNQQIANAVNMPVIVGPIDASAVGNIMIQAKTLNIVKTIWDIRDYVRNTINTAAYLPE